jgi:hypothetical protein
MGDLDIVWRYISFARFVWFLQKKRLWLSRVDKLDDEWELALAGDQLDHVIMRRTFAPIGQKEEPIIERAQRINKLWREMTYVNCWCALPHESHALWRIFCGPSEGVAIQTTLGALKANVSRLAVHPVVYDDPGRLKQTPELMELAKRKRKMFEYEHEVRVIGARGINDPNLIVGEFGIECPFEPELALDTVWVHPEADDSFMETVVATVDSYAPKLRDRVKWSAMKTKPPLLK